MFLFGKSPFQLTRDVFYETVILTLEREVLLKLFIVRLKQVLDSYTHIYINALIPREQGSPAILLVF